MIGALETVSRLCAIGLGLEEDALSTLMHEGPHLLAPTGERRVLLFVISLFRTNLLVVKSTDMLYQPMLPLFPHIPDIYERLPISF